MTNETRQVKVTRRIAYGKLRVCSGARPTSGEFPATIIHGKKPGPTRTTKGRNLHTPGARNRKKYLRGGGTNKPTTDRTAIDALGAVEAVLELNPSGTLNA